MGNSVNMRKKLAAAKKLSIEGKLDVLLDMAFGFVDGLSR